MRKHSLTKQREVTEDKSTKADFHHKSIMQARPNFEQGSAQLGKEGNKQGSESSSGSNYGNEKKWNNEALRRKDMSNYHQ